MTLTMTYNNQTPPPTYHDMDIALHAHPDNTLHTHQEPFNDNGLSHQQGEDDPPPLDPRVDSNSEDENPTYYRTLHRHHQQHETYPHPNTTHTTILPTHRSITTHRTIPRPTQTIRTTANIEPEANSDSNETIEWESNIAETQLLPNSYVGDTLSLPKAENITQLYCQNVNGISLSHSGTWNTTCEHL